jgi:hypothetical protein
LHTQQLSGGVAFDLPPREPINGVNQTRLTSSFRVGKEKKEFYMASLILRNAGIVFSNAKFHIFRFNSKGER